MRAQTVNMTKRQLIDSCTWAGPGSTLLALYKSLSLSLSLSSLFIDQWAQLDDSLPAPAAVVRMAVKEELKDNCGGGKKEWKTK